jgi:hypothetical protein
MKRVEMIHQAQFEQYINLLILYKVQNPGKVVYLNEKSLNEAIKWYQNNIPEYHS